MLIAITGVISSGKSTCCNIINNLYCYPVINLDRIEEKYQWYNRYEVAKKFNINIINKNTNNEREINKKSLQEYIFNNINIMNYINNCTIKNGINYINKYQNCKNIIIHEVPLITNFKIHEYYKYVIVINSIYSKKRLLKQNNIKKETVEKIITIQKENLQKIKYNYIINNNSSLIEFTITIKNIFNKVIKTHGMLY